MKSIADLRAEKKSGPRRPEFSLTLCLAPDLMAEAHALHAEAEALVARPDGPRRMVPEQDPRAEEIRAGLVAIYEKMAEFEGEFRGRANLTDGDWRRWCNAHPPRDEGEPGHDRDLRVAYGYCNADDLLENLAPFAHLWNGEPLDEESWTEVIEPDAYPGDLADIARKVVEMYEAGSSDFRQRRTVLLGSLKRLNGSASLATSASPTSDSTDGNPEPSSGDSTRTGTK